MEDVLCWVPETLREDMPPRARGFSVIQSLGPSIEDGATRRSYDLQSTATEAVAQHGHLGRSLKCPHCTWQSWDLGLGPTAKGMLISSTNWLPDGLHTEFSRGIFRNVVSRVSF